MTINDEVLGARIPRLGTISTGYGVEAVSQSNRPYSRPTRASTLVFHTHDGEVATAVQNRYGGDVSSDSLTWAYDVVTDTRSADVGVLPQGFRQALEAWRAAECLRRCDGVRMVTAAGRPVDQPCACAPEMERGLDRACSPTTILPVLIDLDVERFGVWEVRSNSWGTAAALKGTLRALAMVGATEGMIPAVLTMMARTVRDSKGKPHDVEELHLTIAKSRRSLEALAGQAAALDAGPASLPDGEDGRRLDLLAEWGELAAQAARKGLRDPLLADYRARFGDREIASLSTDELAGWVAHVTDRLWDADGAESPPPPPDPPGEAIPPAEAATAESG